MQVYTAACLKPVVYEPPADRAAADATYERFLAVIRPTPQEAVS